MNSPLLQVGLLTDRDKIPVMFFQEQEEVDGGGAQGQKEGWKE
jgi:hypothetical protein